MKKFFAEVKEWWYWNSEYVTPVILIIWFFIGVVMVLGLLQANSIKYNCNLDKRPSIYMAWMIDTDVHNYAPEKFCADVRERMAKGE